MARVDLNKWVLAPTVAASSLHICRPLPQHVYALPYSAAVYPVLLYLCTVKYDEFFGQREYAFLAVVLAVTTHALLFLAGEWSITAKAKLTCSSTEDPYKANVIRVIPKQHVGSGALCTIDHTYENGSSEPALSFVFQQEKFVYDSEKHAFTPLVYPDQLPIEECLLSRGLADDDAVLLRLKYGLNAFIIPSPTFGALFREHAVAPFFVFQIFCVGLWALDEYWYYSLFTLFMLGAFESTVVFQRLKTLNEFRTMSQKPYPIFAYRDSKWKELKSTSDVVPHDIISVVRPSRDDHLTPCDMALLRGSVVVNEAMLSGESTPLVKESIELRNRKDVLDESDTQNSLHIVHAGTKIVQVLPSASVSNKNYMIGRGPSETEDDDDMPLVHASDSDAANEIPNPPDGGCIGLVLRTGFGTSQGKLVRTMIFSSERVSANNIESFIFILFLLVFAIAAAVYVFMYAESQDESTFNSKLILHCIMIITSVVPPELPMELSMAVNASLVALAKAAVFCTEPFRIPFAGKLDILCFDKTGTITEVDLVLEGVAGIDTSAVIQMGNASQSPKSATSPSGAETKDDWLLLRDPVACPRHTILVLAAAHSLVLVEDQKQNVVGDPMERAALEAANFELVNRDCVRPKRVAEGIKSSNTVSSKGAPAGVSRLVTASGTVRDVLPVGSEIKILRRFAFSSSLKRMSTVAEVTGSQPMLIAAVKGAPETIMEMLTIVPPRFQSTYKRFAKTGSRVLALAWKSIERRKGLDVDSITREEVECNLQFAGFLVFSSRLKPDSSSAIEELSGSSHRCVMITGDNALTACHVAKKVGIVTKSCVILDLYDCECQDGAREKILQWRKMSDDQVISTSASVEEAKSLLRKYDLCATGPAITFINEELGFRAESLAPYVYVWARVLPAQKEAILFELKRQNFMTLMCGDGTNDVGALKQAHVGVALLDCTKEDLEEITEFNRLKVMSMIYKRQCQVALRFNLQVPPKPQILKTLEERFRARQAARGNLLPNDTLSHNVDDPAEAQNTADIQSLLSGFSEEDVPTLNLGDASASAPFTSKIGSLRAVCDIVKQGRCTLVTTLQMYRILALNSLISAYSMSVLFLEGIKWGDRQLTLQGITVAICFFCVTRGRPLDMLSKERPPANLITVGTFSSLVGQFFVHCAALLYVTQLCKSHLAISLEVDFDESKKFEPNLLNTGIFLLTLSMQVSTFVINYIGRPFRESIRENKALMRGLIVAGLVAYCGALEVLPEVNEMFQLVEMPTAVPLKLVAVMTADFAGAFAVEYLCNAIFLKTSPRRELRLHKRTHK